MNLQENNKYPQQRKLVWLGWNIKITSFIYLSSQIASWLQMESLSPRPVLFWLLSYLLTGAVPKLYNWKNWTLMPWLMPAICEKEDALSKAVCRSLYLILAALRVSCNQGCGICRTGPQYPAHCSPTARGLWFLSWGRTCFLQKYFLPHSSVLFCKSYFPCNA